MASAVHAGKGAAVDDVTPFTDHLMEELDVLLPDGRMAYPARCNS